MLSNGEDGRSNGDMPFDVSAVEDNPAIVKTLYYSQIKQ